MDAKSLRNRLRRALSGTLPALALAAGLGATPAAAQSLQEALAQAYQSNPTLDAERAALRATDEQVPYARSGFLPNVTATGEAGRVRNEQGPDVVAISPRSVDVTVTQPLYRGGRTVAAVNRAENLVQAQRASLVATEQSVLLDAATAYLDVVRDQAVLDLTVNNEQVLRRQLEAAQDRFRVGEITRTDVSQSESRLARSTSDRIQAEGLLNASRAQFARLIGAPPARLVQPTVTVALPKTLQETIALGEQNNPNVIASRFNQQASEDNIDLVRGELLPSVSVAGTLSKNWDQSQLVDESEQASIVARVTVPIYEGGATTARVREAKQVANQRRIQIEETSRAARETAIRAWEALVTARASILSRQEQVRSADIALEGVRQEATVGSRTVLDVLDAEQELLNARVELVRSQRDELVAVFQVLAATGQLTAGRLGLPVATYDFQAHYDKVRGKLWGTSID